MDETSERMQRPSRRGRSLRAKRKPQKLGRRMGKTIYAHEMKQKIQGLGFSILNTQIGPKKQLPG
jgi:hypothetical protein